MFREAGPLFSNSEFQHSLFKYVGFTIAKKNYHKLAAELVSDKEASICEEYGLNMSATLKIIIIMIIIIILKTFWFFGKRAV